MSAQGFWHRVQDHIICKWIYSGNAHAIVHLCKPILACDHMRHTTHCMPISLATVQCKVPILDTVQCVPILDTVQCVPILDTVQCVPILDTVQCVPILDTVQCVPILDTVQCVPILDTVQCVPILDTVQCVPILDTVQCVPILDTVQCVPILDTVQCVPILDTVQCVPILDTVQCFVQLLLGLAFGNSSSKPHPLGVPIRASRASSWGEPYLEGAGWSCSVTRSHTHPLKLFAVISLCAWV